MLGLILIYFVGKFFYDLAGKYDRNKWGYAILGVVSYYAGSFLFGIALGLLWVLFDVKWIEEWSDTGINLISIPFGVLACWGTYKLLENRFKNKPLFEENPEILDDEFLS